MKKKKETEENDVNAENISSEEAVSEVKETEAVEEKTADKQTSDELNNKYLRLYAEFDNYRKRTNKDKEELVKYGNESLLYALLPALDNLELALKHVNCDSDSGLVQGVQMTLKEIQRTLEKFGLTRIEADGKPFDPAVHHAMMKVERDDMDEMQVAEELRAGYTYREKVLRPSLVSVSVKTQKKEEAETKEDADKIEIIDNKDTEEES